MMQHLSVLLIILIAFSAYCFGVMIPYQNATTIYYSKNENLTITCTGTDEIMWKRANNETGSYAVITQTPRRKILQIKNASLVNAGIHLCYSATNSSDLMGIFLFPDTKSFYEGRKPIRFPQLNLTAQSMNGEYDLEFLNY
ncbi:uncharacterized protein LOC135847891 [Planococcus citri]|uniref:uncharacterized protein LOC135847891 n=1 Tax=Planococcus citri TaxID=170843 RepID=UPI0031F919AE